MKNRYLVQVQIAGSPICTGYKLTAFNHTDARRQAETIGKNRGTPFDVLGVYQLDDVLTRGDETGLELLRRAVA